MNPSLIAPYTDSVGAARNTYQPRKVSRSTSRFLATWVSQPLKHYLLPTTTKCLALSGLARWKTGTGSSSVACVIGKCWPLLRVAIKLALPGIAIQLRQSWIPNKVLAYSAMRKNSGTTCASSSRPVNHRNRIFWFRPKTNLRHEGITE